MNNCAKSESNEAFYESEMVICFVYLRKEL